MYGIVGSPEDASQDVLYPANIGQMRDIILSPPSPNLYRPGISSSALPKPTYLPQDPTKKSHARRQPRGHVPRPRNAFILFRCDFVRQKKVPEDVENDHRNISRIAGSVWREMTERDKAPWVKMAEKEKMLHSQIYPGYRYSPGVGSIAPAKRKKRGDAEEAEGPPTSEGPDVRVRRRSSSLPQLLDRWSPIDAPEKKEITHSVPSPGGLGNMPHTNRRDMDTARWPLAIAPHDIPERDSAVQGPQNSRHWSDNPGEHVWSLDEWATNTSSKSGLNSKSTVASAPPITLTPIFDAYAYDKHKPDILSLRRSSSCPPGAERIPYAQVAQQGCISALTMTRDDLSRRPSRAIMYQSSPTASSFVSVDVPEDFPFVRQLGRNNRPSLHSGPYCIDPPKNALGWDSPPPLPQPWASWNDDISAKKFPGFDSFGLSKSDILEGFDFAQALQLPCPTMNFTNPFRSDHTSSIIYSPVPAIPPDSKADKGYISETNTISPTRVDIAREAMGSTLRQLQIHADQEDITSQLFPRMSLDDTDVAISVHGRDPNRDGNSAAVIDQFRSF